MKVVHVLLLCVVVGGPCLAEGESSNSQPNILPLWPPEFGSLFQRFVDGFQQYVSSGNFFNPLGQTNGQSSGCGQNPGSHSSTSSVETSTTASSQGSDEDQSSVKTHPAARHSHKGVNKHLHANKHDHENKRHHEKQHKVTHERHHQNGVGHEETMHH